VEVTRRRSTLGELWVWISILALISSMLSLIVFVSHAPDFFMSDDFELIGDALAGVSPLEPVATHMRPIIRLHFLLYRLIPSASFFGALSILLHVLAAGSVYLALQATHDRRVALPVSLLFFSSFLANEAIFWTASAAVLYCMIFSCTSLWCFVRGKHMAANMSLVLAALSYEMWVVVPFLFLFHFRRPRELIAPFAMIPIYLGLHVWVFGGGGASSYGGFSFLDLPVRVTIYLFRLLSPLAGHPSRLVALVLCVVLIAAFRFRPWRFPLTLYVVSAFVFSLSTHVSSRFYYFPSLALILMIVLGLQARTKIPLRVVCGLIAVYLAVASPWINVLDGEDYANRADLHLKLYSELTSKVDQIGDGERAMVINRLGPGPLEAVHSQSVGRPKLLFVRGPAMAGIIYPDDAVRMTLWQRRGWPEEVACGGQRIEVGWDAPIRSTYCFRVNRR